METPILQFGTSRFLQAHADLFVSEALPKGEAVGLITVVQTTASTVSRSRIDAFNDGPFPVQIRGLEEGVVVDRRVEVDSVARALDAHENWDAVEDVFVHDAVAVLSNTGDRGYELEPQDQWDRTVPRSFPAKLAKLLVARYRHERQPLDLFPCELVSGNGAVLRDLVLGIAKDWRTDGAFLRWLAEACRWHSSLVDRIVSEPLEPIGAVAEPYALWAIEAMPGGLQSICTHPAVVVTDDLQRYERLKLYILNLGHTYLAERWLLDRRPEQETVRDALADGELRRALDQLYDAEVLPVFAAIGLGEAAKRYRETVMERMANPFLRHRLADIAQNHEAKKRRRFAPVIELAQRHAPGLDLPTLIAGLASGAGGPPA